MTLSRSVAALVVAAFLLPFFAFAQEEDALRAAIRADVMSDPRSSEMSPTEIDSIVNALASQAEEQGLADEYMEAQNSFDYSVEPPVYVEETGLTPLGIALITLGVVLVAVAGFLIWHRKSPHPSPPITIVS